RLVQLLEQPDRPGQLQQLRAQLDTLRGHLAELQPLLDSAVCLDDDCLAAFASTAQAEGVSLPVARRLLAPLLAKACVPAGAPKPRLPSVAQLGRWSRDAARRAAALLEVLDAFSRPRVRPASNDEI